MTNSSLNHKIRDIWYSATRFQDICPTNKSIIWNSVYVRQLPTANRFLLTGKASYCVLIANCILLTAFLLLSMCEKLSKYRYWGFIILLHLHQYLIQKMIFLLETFKFNHCNNKVPTPPSEFSKKNPYHLWYNGWKKIPNTPTHFFWNKFWIHKCM